MKLVGRIIIVQEDRIRVVDDEGRAYLFIVRKRAAEPETLALWRDRGVRIEIEYEGAPDRGAVANSLRSTSSTR
ncbi:MAG TPA: hypothetical protein VMN78_09115 [Longimicrobiales bacterium]|nr:hypothetical protein [Longimicrobiales bacterium]